MAALICPWSTCEGSQPYPCGQRPRPQSRGSPGGCAPHGQPLPHRRPRRGNGPGPGAPPRQTVCQPGHHVRIISPDTAGCYIL
eukprot:scaffold369385_cov50-Prasinocladus_malaysianus.AAC.1